MCKNHDAGLAPKYLGKGINRNSSIGHTGVNFTGGRICKNITLMINRKQILLGLHAKLTDAFAARKAVEEQYFRLNQKK